jgi:sulfofructose kinase
MFDVCGIGAYCLDYLGVVDAFPAEDEKMELGSIELHGGGNVATALVAVARLGGSACFHGVMGNDESAGAIRRGLSQEGVDVSHLKITEGKNPFSFIIINRARSSRTILYTKSQVPQFREQDVDRTVVGQSKVLLLDFYHEEASRAASEIAHQLSIPVVVDAESIKPLSQQIMKNATHVVASKNFALQFTGRSGSSDMEKVMEELADRTLCPFVCITLGENGSIALERESGRIYRQKSNRVKVVDTTGAGDVFHGAFSYFLAQGYPMEEILRYSAGCAACACRQVGGRKGIPTMKELMDFIKEETAGPETKSIT